ncbi:hypothetical protein [Halodesulfovibrio sp.]|jgi:hypothetical protein|uniref:hypothetical protein n=1 Tax=Halodesulfovibrio sp. TaxID=1912772 RepID=UPI0025CF4DAD|nr:hypothetical protein [Halodesulfovibrio sp.]MCT4628029.1 hypothetical protein [Halodesulfovibrio sp.]
MIHTIKDLTVDTLDKVSTPATRAGNTVERIATMIAHGVDEEVVALQLSKNSHHNYDYTTADVQSCCKLFADTKTKVVVTKKQTRALIEDQGTSTTNTKDCTPIFEF